MKQRIKSEGYKLKDKDVVIYILINPENGYVFYVGRTSMTLRQRLSCLLTDKLGKNPILKSYLTELSENFIKPEIISIDKTDYKNRRSIEEYWIQQFSAWGFNLTNVRHNRNKSYIHRVKKTTHLTQDEKELIAILYRNGDHERIAEWLGCSSELIRVYYKRKTIPCRIRNAVVGYYLDKAKKISDKIQSINVEKNVVFN